MCRDSAKGPLDSVSCGTASVFGHSYDIEDVTIDRSSLLCLPLIRLQYLPDDHSDWTWGEHGLFLQRSNGSRGRYRRLGLFAWSNHRMTAQMGEEGRLSVLDPEFYLESHDGGTCIIELV